MTQTRDRFRALHEAESGFIMPNPWDIGSARILAALGFEALATTSAGHAAVLGRLDGLVTRDEAIAHAHLLVSATPLPVSADLENGYGDSPEEVAETVALADATGLAGCSIEDWGRDEGKLYEPAAAAERVVGAVDRPVNALLLPGGPSSSALFDAGIARVSLGSALSLAANAALVEAGKELLEKGSHDFWGRAAAGAGDVYAALARPE